jgi:hypothetical protein
MATMIKLPPPDYLDLFDNHARRSLYPLDSAIENGLDIHLDALRQLNTVALKRGFFGMSPTVGTKKVLVFKCGHF